MGNLIPTLYSGSPDDVMWVELVATRVARMLIEERNRDGDRR